MTDAQPTQPSPHDYPAAVLAGTIPANRNITAAANRHQYDLDRDDIYWDEWEWNQYVFLCSQLRIVDGHELTGSTLQLLPWQSWVIGSMLCWRRTDTNRRRFKSGFVECARGSGKTTLAATVLLHMALTRSGGDVLTLANTVQQAELAFRAAGHMAADAGGDVNDPEGDGTGLFRITERNIRVPATKSKIRPYASKTSTLDGLKAMAYILDETSQAKDDYIRYIQSALMKNAEAFMLSITTPGAAEAGRDSIYYQRRQPALDGLAADNWAESDVFAALWGLDDTDDMTDPETWIKGAPSLGHVIPVQAYRQSLAEYQSQGKLEDFERFLCCRWTSKGMKWIDGDMWERNTCPDVPEYPTDPETPVYVGLDLSKSFDVSSMCWTWHQDGKIFVRWHHWVISKNEGDEMLDYSRRLDAWRQLPNVTICDHKVQYESVKARLWELKQHSNLIRVGYDRIGGMKTEVDKWGDRDCRYNAETDLPMSAVPQTMMHLGPALHLVECWLHNDSLKMMKCPVVEYCLAGVQLTNDTNGNRKVCKNRSRSIVDPIVAFEMAAAIMILENAQEPGAYLDPDDIAI